MEWTLANQPRKRRKMWKCEIWIRNGKKLTYELFQPSVVHPWLAIQLDYGYDGELSWLFKFVLFQDWWAESFFANHFISQISFDLHQTCIARWNIPINCIKALLIQNHLGHFIPCSICIDVSIRLDWALLFGCLQVHIN